MYIHKGPAAQDWGESESSKGILLCAKRTGGQAEFTLVFQLNLLWYSLYIQNPGREWKKFEKPFEQCLSLPPKGKFFYPSAVDPDLDLAPYDRIGHTLLHFFTLFTRFLVGLPDRMNPIRTVA